MPKTTTQKCSVYGQRKKHESLLKAIPKTSTERVRKFRARQKMLLYRLVLNGSPNKYNDTYDVPKSCREADAVPELVCLRFKPNQFGNEEYCNSLFDNVHDADNESIELSPGQVFTRKCYTKKSQPVNLQYMVQTQHEGTENNIAIESDTESMTMDDNLNYDEIPSNSAINELQTVRKRRPREPPELVQAKRQMDEAFQLIKQASQPKEEDECSTFGTLIAQKLRKLPDKRRDFMMMKINELFYEDSDQGDSTSGNFYPLYSDSTQNKLINDVNPSNSCEINIKIKDEINCEFDG